ncbi:cytochrome c oxidase cbb3-type subunit 3 [Constrictibacter sp. MBR-5]|jgi:cytochrome c oxidase cbb3-type subunit 3|uniref:cytochrome-c oxidase, cbb3-type subunit III n=1 Tax=Constrictibacter sp. MBR-5 TaxID=3156467 RepID=UPI00339A9C0C
MPTRNQKDSGRTVETTGHEWDGIEEYNNPLPKWWLYVFYATIVWSIGYYFIYPAWPSLSGYTKGLAGFSQRVELENHLAEVRAGRAETFDRLASMDLAAIQADPDLRSFAMTGGRAAFADNCVPCHGQGGAGRVGYPSLADDSWIWGGTLQDIHVTLLHGVRFDDPNTRTSQMPVFGDGILARAEVLDLAQHVLSLTDRATDPAAATRGAKLFADNCAACHGAAGAGDRSLGAPALNDGIWLYGSSLEAVAAQISRPRHGVMPAWTGRLDPATVKMLAIYVHGLGGGE